MRRRIGQSRVFAFSALLIAVWSSAAPCGGFFCPPTTTLYEHILLADVAVVARRVHTPVPPEVGSDKLRNLDSKQPRSRFQIVEVLNGSEFLGATREIEVAYTGVQPPETLYLIQGCQEAALSWVVTSVLKEDHADYLRQLARLPGNGCERMMFFVRYLRHDSILLADDAYRELCRVPYREFKSLRGTLDSDQLIDWISDARTCDNYRRVYLHLLASVEQPQPRTDVIELFEQMLANPGDDNPLSSRDAEIACYLTLTGLSGFPLIEAQFLRNEDCPSADAFAAINALRFLINEGSTIPKERLLVGLRHLLVRRDIADLVILELARAGDWSALPRLVRLAKDADEKSFWVRVAVIRYLQVCPLPESATAIEELAQIDPMAVERARYFASADACANPSPTIDDDTIDQAPRDNPAPEDGTSGEGT